MITDKKEQTGTDKKEDYIYEDLTYKIIGIVYGLVLLVNFGTSKVGIKRLIYTNNTNERR